jgi:hypothetical protein
MTHDVLVLARRRQNFHLRRYNCEHVVKVVIMVIEQVIRIRDQEMISVWPLVLDLLLMKSSRSQLSTSVVRF